MSPFKTLLPMLACFAVAACSNSQNGGESDSVRSLNEPTNAFYPTDSSIKTDKVTTSAAKSMLSCEDPTTATRLDSEVFSTSYRTVERSQGLMNGPISVKVTSNKYSTKTGGETSNIGFELVHLSVNGVSSLVQGPYAYTQSCSTKEPCNDDTEKKYTRGSAWTKIETERNHEKNSVSHYGEGMYRCTFTADVDEDGNTVEAERTTQPGTIQLGKERYKAIQMITTQKGKISCNGEVVGKGSEVNRRIVVADELPGLRSDYNVDSNCRRATIFDSYSMKLGDRIILGSSTEKTEYYTAGELKTVEEYKKAKQNITDTRAKLENAVEVARSGKIQAETNQSAALAEASKQEAKATDLDNIAKASELVASGVDATPEQKQKAIDDRKQAIQAEIASDQARKAYIDAKASYEKAVENYEDAKNALSNFNFQNPE